MYIDNSKLRFSEEELNNIKFIKAEDFYTECKLKRFIKYCNIYLTIFSLLSLYSVYMYIYLRYRYFDISIIFLSVSCISILMSIVTIYNRENNVNKIRNVKDNILKYKIQVIDKYEIKKYKSTSKIKMVEHIYFAKARVVNTDYISKLKFESLEIGDVVECLCVSSDGNLTPFISDVF